MEIETDDPAMRDWIPPAAAGERAGRADRAAAGRPDAEPLGRADRASSASAAICPSAW